MVPWVPHSQHPGFGPLGLQHKNSETAAALRQFVVSNRAKPPGPFEAAAPTLTSLSPDSMWPENWPYRNYYLALAHLYLIRQPCLCWVQSTHTGIHAVTGSCPRIPHGRATFQRLKWKETREGQPSVSELNSDLLFKSANFQSYFFWEHPPKTL